MPVILEKCPADNLLLPRVSGRGRPGPRQPPANDSAQAWPFLPDTGRLYPSVRSGAPSWVGPDFVPAAWQSKVRPVHLILLPPRLYIPGPLLPSPSVNHRVLCLLAPPTEHIKIRESSCTFYSSHSQQVRQVLGPHPRAQQSSDFWHFSGFTCGKNI